MKATLQADFGGLPAETAHRILTEFCERMAREGFFRAYAFQIDGPEGPITDKCILEQGRVIA